MAKIKLNATDWRLTGNETQSTAGWRYIYGSTNWTNDTVTLAALPSARPGDVGYINLGLGSDTLIFARNGNYVLNVLNTEVIKAARANTNVNVKFTQDKGFTTDGSLLSIKLDIGHQDLVYTGATLNSTLTMGQGYDQIFFNGTADFDKYWTFIRRDKGQLDAYNLYSGYKVRLQDDNGLNWGRVEKITTANVDGGSTSYMPFADLKPSGSQGMTQNIDLRSDGQSTSDSFNLAYFNSIRYTSDNVWRGEANISDGVRTSTAGNTSVTGTVSLDVIGAYRNGSHDLTVTEQSTSINGQLRLYTFNVASGSYNAFNDVYLGSAISNSADATNNVINGANGTRGNDVADRVALYGFGGNDQLIGGAANDYIFGGQGVYDRVLYTTPPNGQSNSEYSGNAVTGAAGADYFGVGSTNSSGVVTGANTTAASGQVKGYATDVISDFQAHYDTLVVLSNGVAVIGGLGNLLDGIDAPTDYQTYVVQDMSQGNYIDLRATAAVATSDQDNDGAFGGSTRIADKALSASAWDASQSNRDSNSIANEADVTVVNQGLIVVRGQGGDDTILDSSGNDYLYGNGGTNSISLSAGGNDRVYVDTRLGNQNVSNFIKSDGTSSNVDKVYLNKGVIVGVGGSLTADSDLVAESFLSGTPDILAGRSLSGNSSIGTLTSNPGWANKYYASVYDSGAFSNGNVSQTYHNNAYGYTDYINNNYGGVWSGIGYALNAIPIVGPLLAIYPLYLATSYFTNGYKHENLRYTDTSLTKGLTIISAETAPDTTVGQADNNSFLDFFPSADDYQGGDDNFAASLEFTAQSGPIKSYVAVYSDDETFVYLINSKDNVVQNNEATLVAEVSGHLTLNDFVMYDGTQDIYNYGADPVLVYPSTPTITEVISDSDAGVPSTILVNGDVTRDNNPEIKVTFGVTGDEVNVGDTINIYDGFTLLSSVTVTQEIKDQISTDGYFLYTDTRNLATEEVIDGPNSYHDNPIVYYNVEHVSNGLSESSNYFRVEVDTFVDTANSIVLDSDSDFGWTGTDLETKDNTPTLIVYGGKETQYETTISDPDYPSLDPINIAGDIVKIYRDGTLIDTHTMLGADGPTPNDSNGYEFTDSATLADGNYTYTVKMFDALGNVSSTQQVTVHVDSTNPTVTNFTSSTANGYYNESDAINITATTSENVQSGQYIDVTLDTGDVVRLTAAADGTTLTGTYTVGAGDTSADLNITSFTAGTATDKAGNAVLTTLPPSGNILSYNQNLVIDTTDPTVTYTGWDSTDEGSVDPAAEYYINFADALSGIASFSVTTYLSQYTLNGTDWIDETYSTSGNDSDTVLFNPKVGDMVDTFGGDDHRIQIIGTVTDNAGNTSSFDTTMLYFDVVGSPV